MQNHQGRRSDPQLLLRGRRAEHRAANTEEQLRRSEQRVSGGRWASREKLEADRFVVPRSCYSLRPSAAARNHSPFLCNKCCTKQEEDDNIFTPPYCKLLCEERGRHPDHDRDPRAASREGVGFLKRSRVSLKVASSCRRGGVTANYPLNLWVSRPLVLVVG